MNDLFEGFEGVKLVEAASDPFADFEGVTLVDQAAPAAGGPLSAFRAKLADPKEYERIKKWAAYHGMTPEDPIVARRLTNPLNFPSYSTLMKLAESGDPEEANRMTPEGNVEGFGLKAAFYQYAHAGGAIRRRNDALVSRIAARQELEVGDTRDIGAQIATGMAGVPRPNLRTFKKIEDMTRAEQDASVPKEIIDLVNQYDTPEAPLDARTRAEAIYAAAKSSAMARAQIMEMAKEELALREELAGNTGGFLGFLEKAGVLVAKGMPAVGSGNTFLVGSALTGGIAGAAGLTAAGVKTAAMIGSGVLGGAVSGVDKTTKLLSADINPDTGKVEKAGTDYDDARLRGYAYGAFEAATEVLLDKILGAVFKGADKLLTGGRISKGASKGYDALARQVLKTRIGRGIAEFAKGVLRIAGLSATNNPFTELLGEEGIQQWGDAVFAQRPSDTEVPVYVKNVFNEATGEIEQMRVEPGSDEERTAKRMLARYGEKSGYAVAGTRQMTIGEKTREFAWGDGVNKGFVSWENLTALAEGFALQYLLTLGGGAMHAVQTKRGRHIIDTYLMAAGHTNAELAYMSDERKYKAFVAFYEAEANRDKYAEVFKDAGEWLSLSAQRAIDSELFMRTGEGIKPNFSVDVAKEAANGAATVDDEKSGFSVDYTSTLEGTAITVRDRDGVLSPMTFNTAEEAQKGAEKMSQTKQGRQLHMEKRAEIATRVAQVFAPGRNVVLVQSDKDMKAAAVAEGADEAEYKSGNPALTAPNGTIVLNVAAITSFDDLVYNVKHETGHSVADEAGLTKLMAGKTVNWIAAEFQKAKIIAPGAGGLEKFVKAVESVRADYAARGVKLTDAGAVGEVLSMQQERMTPLFRKRFGDGLVTLLRGKDKSAKNMRDVRRAVALIMYSGREAKVDLYGGPDAWKVPAPAFTGDPIAAAGTETGEKEAVEPAGEAAPEAMPAQGEEAPGAETVPPVAASEAKPPAAPSPEAVAAAKDIKAAFEAKQKAKAPVEEAAPVETPPEAPKAEAPKSEPPAPATPAAKMTFPSEEAMLEYVEAHPEETANWTEENFEIVPPPAPAKSDGAPIVPTSEAGQGEAPAVPLVLEGGTPAEIEAEKAKVEAQRKKQEERDEIAKKAAAPLKGDLGDSTPPLPGMEGVAPDDLELLNQKPKEVQNADQERGAEKVAGGEQAGGAEKDGGGDAQGSEAAGTGGKPEGEGLQKRAVEIAEKNAEVEFHRVPRQGSGRFKRGGEYVEIPGVSVGGKRTYLRQSKRGNAKVFYVSSDHHGKVLNGMAALMRVKGASETVSAVRIIGGGKAPEGSEKWGVTEWATHNQKLSNRHKEGAKPAVPTASDSAPTAEAKPVEAPKTEAPKAEPPAPAPKMKFASEEEMMRYVAAHPDETANWTGEEFEIVPDEKGEAAPAAPQAEQEAAPAVAQFEPPKIKYGENTGAYRRRVAAAKAEWDKEQAAKAPAASQETIPGMRAVAQRIVNAENAFIDFAMRTAGLTKPEAETALASYRKNKAIKIDPVGGSFTFTNGGFAEVDVLRRAAGREEAPQPPTPAGYEVDAWSEEELSRLDKLRQERDKSRQKPKVEVKSPVANLSAEDQKRANPTDAKDAEEIAELQANAETQARVRAIPDAEYAAAPALAVMDVELPAYEARKAAATRTADSKERQAYSTPPPLAAIGAEAAMGTARDGKWATIVEPTAGNGGLLATVRSPDMILANELDAGRSSRLTDFLTKEMRTAAHIFTGDYGAEEFQNAIRDAASKGKRAFLMNPPFGPADESGYKLEHKIALKTIESAVPGDTLFFIGAAPGRNAMKMPTGALAGVYTAGAFAKFHQELNRRGWKATLHFIADGALYRKMGASFPVEVLLMEKTDGSEMNPHMPMRDLPARYSTWEHIRAAVAEMYDPGAETLGERVANNLDLSGKAEQARAEAQGNAEASSAEVNAARVKEGAAGTLRYRLSQDIELGLVTPETGLTLNPFMMKINGKIWDKEFAGKVHNPDQLARHILSLPAEIAEARIKVADAIAKHLAANPANGFVTGTGFNSMGPALREAFEARWNAARTTDMDAEEDKAQLDYDPLSAVKVASPMKVPRELAGGMAAALISFDERHPEGIDTFVAEKMRRPMTEKELDGSQIDTLGLALEKIDEGTGFIVGSQTGAGKGRVMASVMDYHILNGRVPIFLTAQAKLFTDIWRDITAIGAQDRFKPLVMNDYKAPKNEDPDSEDADAFSMPVFFTPVRRNSALSEGKLPQGANAIFLTYSQVQNPTANTRLKIDLIKKLLVSGKGALVMDEAHLAAGADSNRGAVLREFADLAKPGVVFSSATFAKRGENMTLYKRAGYSQFFKNDEDMEKALMVGGVPFQQYLAARLTERGFYVRHELDYENVIFEKLTTIDTLGSPQERTALSQREEQIADVFNQAVRSVIRFGGMVKTVNSRLQKGAPVVNMDGAAFMSSLHNTASFIYTALKAETVANAAVAELRAGRAPVVTLYNTNQALLTEIGLGQKADVGRYLTRISERAVSIQMPDGSSASILTPAGFGELVRLVKTQEATMLRDAADALVREARSAADYLREQNLPASPIDRVREIVENAGYQFGEVTGRTLMVQNGVVVRKIKPNPDTVIRQFNQGAPDGSPNMVLVLSSSGSTGLSAHASSDFRNQAQRVLFVLQPAWDINEMMQMFGRVNRKNQLSKPIYYLVFTSAAGEQRNAAILMSKLRSLSANTSGVSKAGYGEEVEDALDFMNVFGDKALAELAAERNPVVAAINALRPSTGIRAATSISQFLPVREQEQFIGQIQAKVAALQDNAREAGLHDLEAGDIGRVPLTVEQLLSDSAMRAYEVPVLGRGKILTASEAVAAAQAWQAKHPTMLDDAKAKIDKAIAGTSNPWLKRIYGNTAQVLERALDSIGQVYYVRDDVGGGRRWFVPIEARLPPSGTAQTASDWRVKVSFNTIRGVTTIPLSIFADKILSNAAKSSERNYNETLTRKEDRTIIAGDVAQALIGNIVATGASGASQIVRALPADGNFSSFVLMMPRGVTVANAKKIVSSRLEKVTDVMDIRPVARDGALEIDAGRVKVTPTYSSTTGDQIGAGAVFAFRIATPAKSKSKKITVAEIMRAAGAESRLRDTPDSRGYVTGPYLGVDEANTALKNLAALHPALQATQIVSDEAKVGGQDAVARNAPRFKLAGVKLDAAAEPVFFSQLRRTLEAKMPNRMTVMALRGMIDPSRSGVKADEIEWTGLKDFLDGKNPGDYVTKAEVLEATKDVEIREVVKGQTQAELDMQEELTPLARLGRDRTPEQDARYEQLARRLRIGKDLDNATKFEQYQLPGGENYRELLLTLPNRERYYLVEENGYWWVFDNNKGRTVGKGYDYESEAKQHLAEYYQDVPVGEQYRSSHWEEPNVLAHIRFNERQAANGDKTLFLEEVQSDRHQEGKKKGYAKDTTGWTARLLSAPDAGFNHWQINDAKGNEVTKIVGGTKEAAISKAAEGVPDAPFKDTSKGWARLAFKRMLRWAAENNFDRIAWTTGEQQAERYDLSKHISMASAISNGDGTYNLIIEDMRGDEIAPYSRSGKKLTPAEMEDTIGKDLAAKLIEGADRNKGKPWPKSAPSNPAFFTLRGLDLKVGGEGMRTFYDQILPSIANDIGKKFGARVEDVKMGAEVDGWAILRDGVPVNQDRYATAEQAHTVMRQRGLMGEGYATSYHDKNVVVAHSLPITPAMRDSVMQGQPRFKLPGVKLDAEHADAVSRGDMDTAQRMVDEAAKAAGYDVEGWHGTRSISPITEFRTSREGKEEAIFFSDSKDEAVQFPYPRGSTSSVRAWLKGNFAEVDAHGELYEPDVMERWIRDAREAGKDGVHVRNIQNFENGARSDTYAVFKPSQIKSADAATYDDNGDLIPLSRRFDDARADIRFKLPGVTLDDDISAPVRVGELRTQAQLENDDPVGFPILDHIRGGSPIIIPRGAIGRKGEYDWFTEAGGLKAFNLAERKAFFRYPKAALGEKKSRGNIDQLAKELNFDDVETFANAFMAEVERSRALYREQKERQAVRRNALETFSESPHLAGMKNIEENLGKAVGFVFDSLQGEEKATLEMIGEREGTDAVRDYILRQHIDLVALDMIERHAFQMEVESGARDEAPPIIQDRGTLAIDTPVNEKGDTRPVFDQTKESLDVKRARLYAQALQGVPTITDEAAAAHVREALDVGGKLFLRDIAQKLTAERLTGATTRPLDKLQTAIMLWYQTDLDERAKDSDRQAQAAVEAHDLNNLNAVDMMRDSLNRETIDYLNAARQYGSLAGQALQALKLRVDHAFDIVKIYRQAREDIGRELTRAEFEKLKARIDILEKKWNDYVDAATLPDGEGELDTRVVELEKKLADVTAARAAVKTEVDRLEAKKAALEAEYAKQSREATAFSEKKAQLEAQIAGIENEIALREALNQQVEELQGKVDALQAKLDALDAEYAGASPELLASLEKQLADLTKLHAEKLAAYQKTDEELKTANERLKRVRKLIEKLGKGTKAKIARRRAVIENAANLYKEFKAEMERAQVERLKARWRSAPLPKKALMAFEGVENIIQGLQSMVDESVAGRQLIKIGRAHPIMWARAFAQSQHIVFHRSGMTDDTGRTLTWQERSDRYYYELDQAQREDPLFDILVRKGGLDWMDITADPTSFDEQQIPVGPLLNNMLPSKATRFVTSVLGVSNNHYAGMSNLLRFTVAKQLYNQMSVAKGETPNEDDIYAIVSTVDIFGGRGDMSTQTARAVIDFGRHLLYSPRLALANAQYYRRMFGMLANPRYSRQARKMILMEYVRSGIGYATLSFIARVLSWLLYDDKDQQRFQFRSGHPAYTQLMFGQQRVDITGGQATWDRAAMNFLGGGLIDLLPEWARDVISVIDNGDKLATETGLVITEQYKREKGDYAALGRFARSKLKPLTGMFIDLARGKNYEGQAAGPRAQPHQPGYDRRYLNLLRSIAPVPLSLQTAGELYMGDPDQGIEPVRNPFLFVNWMSMELLGMLARSLPINAELAQQVAEGYTKNAEELESLKRKQRDIMNDRKMSPEMKELEAGRIQDKLDRLRGM